MRYALLGLGTLMLLGVAASDGLAGKPPPPPPPPPPGPTKVVYYKDWTQPYVKEMNAWDGSGKTVTPVAPVEGYYNEPALSFAKYNGAYVHARLEPNGVRNHDRTWPVEGRPFGLPVSNNWPVAQDNNDVVVQRLDSATPLRLFHDTSFLLMGVAFIPGSPEKIAFNSCYWVTDASGATTLRHGLFLADLAFDGAGNITGLDGAPRMVFDAAPPTITPISPYNVPPPTDVQISTTLYPWAAWISPDRVIASFQPTLRVVDLATPSASYDLVQGVRPVLSPSKTRVAYLGTFNGTGGLWDINLDGTGRTLWVASEVTNRFRAKVDYMDYYDDNTLVYEFATDFSAPVFHRTCDVFRKPRGGAAVNLTADTIHNVYAPVFVR